MFYYRNASALTKKNVGPSILYRIFKSIVVKAIISSTSFNRLINFSRLVSSGSRLIRAPSILRTRKP